MNQIEQTNSFVTKNCDYFTFYSNKQTNNLSLFNSLVCPPTCQLTYASQLLRAHHAQVLTKVTSLACNVNDYDMQVIAFANATYNILANF